MTLNRWYLWSVLIVTALSVFLWSCDHDLGTWWLAHNYNVSISCSHVIIIYDLYYWLSTSKINSKNGKHMMSHLSMAWYLLKDGNWNCWNWCSLRGRSYFTWALCVSSPWLSLEGRAHRHPGIKKKKGGRMKGERRGERRKKERWKGNKAWCAHDRKSGGGGNDRSEGPKQLGPVGTRLAGNGLVTGRIG